MNISLTWLVIRTCDNYHDMMIICANSTSAYDGIIYLIFRCCLRFIIPSYHHRNSTVSAVFTVVAEMAENARHNEMCITLFAILAILIICYSLDVKKSITYFYKDLIYIHFCFYAANMLLLPFGPATNCNVLHYYNYDVAHAWRHQSKSEPLHSQCLFELCNCIYE